MHPFSRKATNGYRSTTPCKTAAQQLFFLLKLAVAVPVNPALQHRSTCLVINCTHPDGGLIARHQRTHQLNTILVTIIRCHTKGHQTGIRIVSCSQGIRSTVDFRIHGGTQHQVSINDCRHRIVQPARIEALRQVAIVKTRYQYHIVLYLAIGRKAVRTQFRLRAQAQAKAHINPYNGRHRRG